MFLAESERRLDVKVRPETVHMTQNTVALHGDAKEPGDWSGSLETLERRQRRLDGVVYFNLLESQSFFARIKQRRR